MTTNTISSTPSSGGGKKSTSSTTAIATVKWDDQTANRFASLRTSLQHALIDSTLPLPAATTKKGADSPFSPTRPSATISAHYSRSHSESAALNSAAKVEMPSLRQNNYNSSLLPPSSNNNNSSAASSKQRTMISPSNNVTNGGVNAGVFPFARSKSSPLPPVVDNQQTKSNQNQLQQQPLLGRSISYSNSANSNDDNNIKIEDDDGLATMLATPPNNNHHYQYHVNAIRALLSDTPLPLAISTPSDSYTNNSNDDINDNANRSNNSSSNRMTILQPRQPKHNEHIYLLPRLYMRKWCDWTRNDVIVSCVDQWLSSSSSMMCRSNNGENTTAARAKVFELPHHAVQTLAALSVISDQYQFYSDDYDYNHNTGTGNEEEWTKWWESVETCWMDWMTCVNERGWLLLSSTSDNTTDGGILYDEKKEDGTTNHQTTEGMMHASQLFRDMFQMLHPTSCPPGAIDARMLIRQNKTLQLRRNVSLVMRGMNGTDTSGGNRNANVMTVQQEMDDEALINYIESSETDENAPHLAVNPVPSSFYETLRQTLGVLCEDNRTISYQPSAAVKNGGEQNGMSLLYHDQWKSDPPSPHNNAAKKNMDIHYPSSPTGGKMNNAANNPKSNSEKSARPIEFRRRFLLTSSGGGQSTTKPGSTASPSYASLLKEATQSMKESQIGNNKQEAMNSVEVYPVEFHYSIIDGVSSPLPPAAVNTSLLRHCQQGMALASRASLAKNVLHDLERAASPGRSSACIRLWMKSRPYADVQAGIKGATKNGDGFDLIDLDSLVFSPPKKPKMPKSPPRSGRKSNDRPLTVGEWLKIGLTQPQSQKSPPVVVELLIEIRSSPTARWVRESLELENRLQVGDFVDAQDSARQWYEAIVREVAPDTVKVHYFGWGSKWDAILPRRRGAAEGKLKSKSPPVPLWSRTSRWREQIKVGDEVEVRESSSLVQRPKWHRATVLAVGRETDPPRELVGGAELEAMDDNGHGKKVPLLLLNRKRQILVEVPQERLKCTSPLPTVRSKNDDGLPVAQPPFIRWVNLYSEEICQVNTHQTREKKQTDAPATASYVMESKRELVEVMKPFNNIHGSGFVRESLRGNPIASGTVGLHNLGNSCYMNSILQCLNQIKPITNFFLQGEYLKEINKNNPLGSGGRISTAYASFLNDVWGNDYSILAPRLLKQTVGSFAPQFNNNFQHDSQEFCQFLMDGLHEDLNRVKNKPYVEQFEAYGMEDRLAAEESWRNHLKRHDSIFVDYTQGMHRSHLTCPGCGRESVKFDVYSSISLPLVPPKSGSTIPLKDCLDQFAAGEQLDEHNAWYCSNCKSHVCALKLITLWNTPDVLVLHLKRFTFEKCPDVDGRILRRKIEDTVNFPIDRLDLTEYVLGPIDPNAPPIYKLFGVSEHSGTTANTGHYTATVRNSEDGNWYRYNDSNVGFTSGDAAITGGAYLLFYQRIKGSLRWAGMEKELNGTPNVDEDGFQAVVGKKKKNRR